MLKNCELVGHWENKSYSPKSRMCQRTTVSEAVTGKALPDPNENLLAALYCILTFI